MGAQFQFDRVEKKNEAEVRAEFDRIQNQAAFENGHSYSGDFNMADGLEFRNQAFADRDDAYDWLDENAKKWGPAIAVKHVSEGGEHLGYFIGANCAS